MKLDYTLTLADYKAAQRLHIRQKLSRRINLSSWFIGVPILAVLGMVFFIKVGRFMHIDIGGFIHLDAIFFGLECGLIYFAIYLPIGRSRRMRKNFNQTFSHSPNNRIISIDIDDNCIFSSLPGVCEGKIFWNAIEAFAQDDKITLLYTAENRFLYFPTSVLSPEQRTELNEIVIRHGLRKEK